MWLQSSQNITVGALFCWIAWINHFFDYLFFPVHNLLSFIERSTQIHSQSDPISPINALNRGFFGGSWLEYNLKTSNYGDVAGDVVLFDWDKFCGSFVATGMLIAWWCRGGLWSINHYYVNVKRVSNGPPSAVPE